MITLFFFKKKNERVILKPRLNILIHIFLRFEPENVLRCLQRYILLTVISFVKFLVVALSTD